MRRLVISFALFLAAAYQGLSQDGLLQQNLAVTMEGYVADMASLKQSAMTAHSAQLSALDRLIKIADMKWNLFYSENADQMTSEAMMAVSARYEQALSEATEAVQTRRNYFSMISKFADAEKRILSSAQEYDDKRNKAFQMSLVKQTAEQLEKFKAGVALDFESVTAAYTDAKQAAESIKELEKRYRKVEETYIDIKTKADQISQMKYTPWIQRIKDYVMSLAAVAIILMFITFVALQISNFKKAREAAQKLQKTLNANDDIPTI